MEKTMCACDDEKYIETSKTKLCWLCVLLIGGYWFKMQSMCCI